MLETFKTLAQKRLLELKKKAIPEPPRQKVPFLKTLLQEGPRSLILEYKRSSPSHGPFSGLPDLPDVIAIYEKQKASALSILTEENHFLGSLEDLSLAAKLTDKPLLRKDFLIDPFDVAVADAYGADAILIIVAMLEDREINALLKSAEDRGLDALVEVHNEIELQRALEFPVKLIGINNRNLQTLQVDTDNYLSLLEKVPESVCVVAESGYASSSQIAALPERTTAVLAGTSFLSAACHRGST